MNTSYGWVVVGAGMVMTCIGIGAMMSLGVFLAPIGDATGWSRTGISTAATLDFFFMGIASLVWGAIADRYGTRIVVLAGSLICGSGLLIASRASNLTEFQAAFGILIGVAAGSFYAPMMAVATQWLAHRRNLAAALVSAGMGMGTMLVAPFAGWLLTFNDWRATMLIMGVTALTLMVPAALLVRPAPAESANGTTPTAGATSVAQPDMTAWQALRTTQFLVIALAHFACCAAHSGPIFHMPSYAMFCGMAPLMAAGVLSLAGLAGLGGRISFGLLADRLGTKQVLVTGLSLQALAVGLYLFVRTPGEFYANAILFGIAYGGVMPLYAVLVRETFGARIMATMFGAVIMFANVGMALGPAAGGFAFDTFGNYQWLYVGSFAIGIAAAAIAITFRPRGDRMQPEMAHA